METNSAIQTSVLMNEQNWSEVVSNISAFPFRISELQHIDKSLALQKISFKFNLQGKELYSNGKKDVALHSGDYLLATNQQTCNVLINEKLQTDLGLCIDIHPQLFAEALQVKYAEKNFENLPKIAYFLEDEYFNKYKANANFAAYLQALFYKIKNKEVVCLKELQCDFIAHFLHYHEPHLISYSNVPVSKQSTKIELFNKLIVAKNMLHDSIYINISIPEIAKQIYLSEYRLYHLFKSTFHISPYKYLLQLRLQESLHLRKTNHYNWTEIANLLQFADVQSFSKLFKKYYKLSPTEYREILS